MRSVLPVLAVLAAIVAVWYAAAVWLNSAWTYDQAARAGTQVSLGQVVADTLAQAIREVIAEAVEAGGSSLRDYVHTDGSLGYFQHSFAVYDREGEPCRHAGCGGTVRRVVQSGRSTFYCGTCQR